jgi:CheY-like chemotaxis protein
MNAIETIILLIDDDLIANFYNQKVILKIQPTAKVISFEGAKMALDYLNKLNDGDDGKYPSPDIILLDINMPEMDGRF